MKMIPIQEKYDDNEKILKKSWCRETIYKTIEFYKKVGFVPPWICYYASRGGNLVGSAGFKGPPVNGKVEIAYSTFEKHRNKGIGTAICRHLVELSQEADPSVKITARTLPVKSFSTRILEKNNFKFSGIVNDPDDGEVWEWLWGGIESI